MTTRAKGLSKLQYMKQLGFEGYEPPNFGNPAHHPASQPYLFFALNEYDTGDHTADRQNMAGFATRQPSSVIWSIATSSVVLTVSNGGLVASDLIRIDYQLRYCLMRSHLPHQGFVPGINHAAELVGSSKDYFARLDYVPAHGHCPISINLSLTHPDIVNIYLRARVRPLFSKKSDPGTWDFSRDPSVIEATWVADP